VKIERGLWAGHERQVGVDDHELQISSQQQHVRGRAVQRKEVDCEHAGVHGGCIIAQLLPYVDINRLFLVPVNHSLHRGVIRDLLLELLQSPNQLKKLCEEHAAKGGHRSLALAEKAVADCTAARVCDWWMWDPVQLLLASLQGQVACVCATDEVMLLLPFAPAGPACCSSDASAGC
jgi:hypothetical protein